MRLSGFRWRSSVVFLELPVEDDTHYIMYIDDVIRYCLPMIFVSVDYDHFEAYSFKFSKDAEMELDNESDARDIAAGAACGEKP